MRSLGVAGLDAGGPAFRHGPWYGVTLSSLAPTRGATRPVSLFMLRRELPSSSELGAGETGIPRPGVILVFVDYAGDRRRAA